MKISELTKIRESYKQAVADAEEQMKRVWRESMNKADEILGTSYRSTFVNWAYDNWDRHHVDSWENELRLALEMEAGTKYGKFDREELKEGETYLANFYFGTSMSAKYRLISKAWIEKVLEIAERGEIV